MMHDDRECDVCRARYAPAAKRGRAAAAKAMREKDTTNVRLESRQEFDLIQGPVEVAGMYRRTGQPDDGGAYMLAGDENIREMP